MQMKKKKKKKKKKNETSQISEAREHRDSRPSIDLFAASVFSRTFYLSAYCFCLSLQRTTR